jgi:hypothetical protein
MSNHTGLVRRCLTGGSLDAVLSAAKSIGVLPRCGGNAP